MPLLIGSYAPTLHNYRTESAPAVVASAAAAAASVDEEKADVQKSEQMDRELA